jgi:DHA1 family bicyclomycin/chloramphenicol resistance-like MFS transporter
MRQKHAFHLHPESVEGNRIRALKARLQNHISEKRSTSGVGECFLALPAIVFPAGRFEIGFSCHIGFVRSAVVLGLLAVVGPFAIDLYLPAMPQIVADLNTDDAAVQFTFTVYFIAFGLAQLIYGPLADRYGRRLPVFLGLVVYIIGSLMCAWAADVDALTLGRLVQAIGAGAPMVIVRAVVRDLHTGTEATRLMALVMLVFSISPMLAPLAGSVLITFGSWRLIFLTLGVLAFASMVMIYFQLPETLPPERRSKIDAAALVRSTIYLSGDARFLGLTLIGGFALASFFVFIAAAPLVYMTQYELTPTGFQHRLCHQCGWLLCLVSVRRPLGRAFRHGPWLPSSV